MTPQDEFSPEHSLRLARFRREAQAAGETLSRSTLEGQIARATELGLREDEVREELAHLRACIDAIALKARLARGEVPTVETSDMLPAGDTCHFVCPVRSGRRRADSFGQLVLSSARLHFRGTLDVRVLWSDVARVRRSGREIVVAIRDSRRELRFACHSQSEAARAAVIAEHLARTAHDAEGPRAYHASL